MRSRRILGIALLPAIALALTAFYGWTESRREPIVHRIDLPFPCCGKPAKPVRILLLSDIHVVDLGFSRDRLARIVAQANALHPDLVLIGGDFVGGAVEDRKVSVASALLPLRGLRPAIGSIAVLGNHDHAASPAEIVGILEQAGITVLRNQAVRSGGLVIGGVDDYYSGHAGVGQTLRAMEALGGPGLLLTHSPDIFPALPARTLLLAGHTHCGQVVLPLVGALVVPSHYGQRYVCGLYREAGRTMIVTGGTGYSQLPIRLGAPPEMWLIELGLPAPQPPL